MNLKRIAMWTVGIFVGVMLLSALMGACAGPRNAGANPGSFGQPGYQQDSSNGWLWGLGGLAAGYGLGKFLNRDKAKPAYQQKTFTPGPTPKPNPDKTITTKPVEPVKQPASTQLTNGTSNQAKPAAPPKQSTSRSQTNSVKKR